MSPKIPVQCSFCLSLLSLMPGFHDQSHKIAAATPGIMSSFQACRKRKREREKSISVESTPFFELSWKLHPTSHILLIRNGLATEPAKEAGKCSFFNWSSATPNKNQSLVAKERGYRYWVVSQQNLPLFVCDVLCTDIFSLC